MFRLYAQKRNGSYVKITEKETANEIEKIASRLKVSQYYCYLIIENDGEGDRPYDRQVLTSEPVKIEVVDEDCCNDIDINTVNFYTDGEKIINNDKKPCKDNERSRTDDKKKKKSKETRMKKKEDLRKLTEKWIDR